MAPDIRAARSAGESRRTELQSRRSPCRHSRRITPATLRTRLRRRRLQLRTKSRYAGAIRELDNGANRGAGPAELTPTELLTVTTIAYLQPATRAELSRLIGKEVSRDIIGRLKGLDLIAARPRPVREYSRGLAPMKLYAAGSDSFLKHLAAGTFVASLTSSFIGATLGREALKQRSRPGSFAA